MSNTAVIAEGKKVPLGHLIDSMQGLLVELFFYTPSEFLEGIVDFCRNVVRI